MQLLDLAILQTTTGYPCVSVLAQRRSSPADHRNALTTLIAEADRRLHSELGPTPSAHLVDRLHTLAGIDVDPTARSMAIFVGNSLGKMYPLPVDVHDRVVIDDSFATRDLVRTHHHTTSHLLVTASAAGITLYDGNGPTLTAISHLPTTARPDLAITIGWLDHTLDRATTGDVPILLAATAERIDDILIRSRHTITSTIVTPATTPTALAAAVAPTLAELRTTHQAQTLHDLGRGILVTDVRDVWRALQHDRVDLLVVEDSYAVAGRHGNGDLDLDLVDDATAPGVIDDIVDDAVEAAMARRSRVEFVPDDSLQQQWGSRIAARLYTADR